MPSILSTRARLAAAALAGASLCLLPSCGTPAGPILTAAPDALSWPAPPDAARLRYLGSISTDQDLKPARSGLQVLGTNLFGADAPKAMTTPLAVCTDDTSRAFVADTTAKVVHVFDLESRVYSTLAPPDGFSMPVALAFDSAPPGQLFVADSVDACVYIFDRAGKFTRKLGEGDLKRPCGIAVASDGRILVSDIAAHQVVVFAPDGEELLRIGMRGSALGQFNYPTNLAFDHAGNLLISDSLNFRVQVFSPALLPVRQIGRQGDVPGTFAQPKGIAVDPDDHIYVVDSNFEAVQLFDLDGSLLMGFGHEGSNPGEFWLPAGIHIDSKARVWIADSYNQRVQVFQYLREGVQP